MAIALDPPVGGVVCELGGKSRPLVLRNGDIERFEEKYDLGIFAMIDRLFGAAEPPQARHVRDLVALGLVGGGMMDRAADDLIQSLPPSENHMLRDVAADLLLTAFLRPKQEKKSAEDGSSNRKSGKATSGGSKRASGKSRQSV